ncbi:MAG: SDR family oxidoreductase [Pedobacter sp.]|nr:SDR family oxidoreductase [Pedobacter sp.]
MKIVVTGATGFVGKSLIEKLNQKSFLTVAVGRKLTTSNAKEFIALSNFSEKNIWQQGLINCDVVIHLAARVHVMQEVSESSLEAFRGINLYGTVNLANAAAKAGVKRFVYVSSIKVNGESTTTKKFIETDTPNPLNPYAISKWEAEKALRKIEQETGMEVVILRPPLIYGPGVKANFASLLKLVDKGFPLPLLGFSNRRSLIFLDNFVDAIIICVTHTNAAGKTYLVSDGVDLSTAQLVRKIAVSLNRRSNVFYFPLIVIRLFAKLIGKTSSINRLTESLVIDSSKIRKELDWQPPFSIDQGLKITADAYLKTSTSELI